MAIDPIDKINAANDAKVQNDIGQIGQGMEAYAVSHNAVYSATLAILVTAGDLKVAPAAPTGYTAYTLGAGGASQTACGQLKAKKYTATPTWSWCSASGKAGPVAGACSATPACP